MSGIEIGPEVVKTLLDAFDRSDWREMTISVGGDTLHVSRDANSSGPSLPPAAAVACRPTARVIRAPKQTCGPVPSPRCCRAGRPGTIRAGSGKTSGSGWPPRAPR